MRVIRVLGRLVAAVAAAYLLYLSFGALSGVWDPEQDNSDTAYVTFALVFAVPGLFLGWVALSGHWPFRGRR